MESGTIERRRTLGGASILTPPEPKLQVFPSMGNTLTAYSAGNSRSGGQSGRSGGNSTTVTNSSYSWWDAGITAQDLVDMTEYDSVTCTKSGSNNMVWCFIYCPGTVGAELDVVVSYHTYGGRERNTHLTVTSTGSSFISLDLENAFDSMSGGSSPNWGHPYLDTANLEYITVTAAAYKNSLWSPEKTFNIYVTGSTVTIKAPSFDPPGSTYQDPQQVQIYPDSTIQGLDTRYTISASPEDPTQNDYPYIEGRPLTIAQTCYLNARSFLTMNSGTVVSSPTKSEEYIITNGSGALNPPTLTPNPGTYTEAQTIFIGNPNLNANQTQVIYYNLDNSAPTINSSIYTYPFNITDTTAISAAVYDSSTGIWSETTTGTYTISNDLGINEVSYMTNSDGMSSCGLFELAKKSNTGNQEDNYGFSISGTSKSTVVYFTMDGTEPTTQSQSILNGQWYSLTEPNTVLVKYLAVAPNCYDSRGQFWVRVNKCVCSYIYSGRPFLIGRLDSNWLMQDESNYGEMCSYLYLNGRQIFKENLTEVSAEIDGNQCIFLIYNPPAGTSIDAGFRFTIGYSVPSGNTGGYYCPLNLSRELSGTMYTLYNSLKTTVFGNCTGVQTVYVSSNEINTLSVSGQMHMIALEFGGLNAPYVRPCVNKTSLETLCVYLTNLTSIDLRPCLSMQTIENSALSHTFNGTFNETGLTSVLMPYRVSTLGENIVGKHSTITVRRPISFTFYNPVVPSATFRTFTDYTDYSSIPLGSDSTVVVNEAYLNADVCSYENAWHYHSSRSGSTSPSGGNLTNMKIVDQDGLECGEMPGDIPTVITGTATNITTNSATFSQNNVTSDGGHALIEKGVCWSSDPAPAIYGSHQSSQSTATGSYSITIGSVLASGTTYYYRAYARNSIGTAYGETKTFTTPISVVAPTVGTAPYAPGAQTNVNPGSSSNRNVTTGWRVMDNGGSQILETAVVWSTTNQNPTTADETETASSWNMWGYLCFSSQIDWSNLSVGTHMYIRGAARNSAGWGYSDYVVDFEVPAVDYTPPSLVTWSGHKIHRTDITYGRQIGDYYYPSSVRIFCFVYPESYGGVYGGPGTLDLMYGTSQSLTPGVGDTAVATCNYDSGLDYEYHTWHNLDPDVHAFSYTIDAAGFANLPIDSSFYAKIRIKGTQETEWSYSELMTISTAPYNGGVHTNSVDNIFGEHAIVDCTWDSIPAATYYDPSSGGAWGGGDPYYINQSTCGIVFSKKSENPSPSIGDSSAVTEYLISNGTGNVLNDQNRRYFIEGLRRNTTYVVRAFMNSVNGIIGSGVEPDTTYYGELLEFTTTNTLSGYMTVKPDTSFNKWENHRKCAKINVSFERWWQWPSNTYSWGYDGMLGSYHLENPWSYFGNSNGNNDTRYGQPRDLFGWGCTSQPHRSDNYDAWDSGSNPSDFCAYDVGMSALTNQSESGQANWGFQNHRYVSGNYTAFHSTDFIDPRLLIYNPDDPNFEGWHGMSGSTTITPIGEGTIQGIMVQDYSRPLTHVEMQRVLFERTTASGKRFCKASVAGVDGLVIFNDDWGNQYSVNRENDASAPYSSNTIPESVWNTYFDNYAVFLPAAGYGNVSSSGTITVEDYGTCGYYWLNDAYSTENAWCLCFTNSSVWTGNLMKNKRLSVRLFRAYA